jgi:hypothetical protein
MFLWYPVMDLARAPRRTARKKGSGYENVPESVLWVMFTLYRIAFRSGMKKQLSDTECTTAKKSSLRCNNSSENSVPKRYR